MVGNINWNKKKNIFNMMDVVLVGNDLHFVWKFASDVKKTKNIKKQAVSLQSSYNVHVLAQRISLDFVFCNRAIISIRIASQTYNQKVELLLKGNNFPKQ